MKWYQLHLSTLLVLLLLAGVFLRLNVQWRDTGDVVGIPIDSEVHTIEYDVIGRGWPFLYESWCADSLDHRYNYDWTTLLFDAVICLLLLALAGAGVEWATRRMRGAVRT